MGGVSEVDLNSPDEKWTYDANAVVFNPLSDPVLTLEEDRKVHMGGYYNGAPVSFPNLINTINGLMIAQLDAQGALSWHKTFAFLPGPRGSMPSLPAAAVRPLAEPGPGRKE